ncbi:hypothetical protein PSPO01_13309 [Paraphaeosphaeria sporulosa]
MTGEARADWRACERGANGEQETAYRSQSLPWGLAAHAAMPSPRGDVADTKPRCAPALLRSPKALPQRARRRPGNDAAPTPPLLHTYD